MRHHPTLCEKLIIVSVMVMLLIAVKKANSSEHPFIRFEKGFNRLIDGYGHKELNPEERKKLARAIWRGCNGNFETATTLACIGAQESNYNLPDKKHYSNYHGKNYEKIRGYFGCHTTTLLAEVKRSRVGGKPSMWSAYWKRDTINASYFSACRFSFIVGVYGVDNGIRQWLTGQSWRTSKKEKARAEKYIKANRWLKRKIFTEK